MKKNILFVIQGMISFFISFRLDASRRRGYCKNINHRPSVVSFCHFLPSFVCVCFHSFPVTSGLCFEEVSLTLPSLETQYEWMRFFC